MNVEVVEMMVVHTQGARTVMRILRVLSCAGGKLPST